MTRNQALSVVAFAVGLLATLGGFGVAYLHSGLPRGQALAVGALAGVCAVVAFCSRPSEHWVPQSSEPDASGSVDQNPTPVGPVTNGDEPEAEGLAGGGVEVALAEARREPPR